MNDDNNQYSEREADQVLARRCAYVLVFAPYLECIEEVSTARADSYKILVFWDGIRDL